MYVCKYVCVRVGSQAHVGGVFLVAVVKYSDRSNLRKERIYLGFQFLRDTITAEKPGGRSRKQVVMSYHTQEAESK